LESCKKTTDKHGERKKKEDPQQKGREKSGAGLARVAVEGGGGAGRGFQLITPGTTRGVGRGLGKQPMRQRGGKKADTTVGGGKNRDFKRVRGHFPGGGGGGTDNDQKQTKEKGDTDLRGVDRGTAPPEQSLCKQPEGPLHVRGGEGSGNKIPAKEIENQKDRRVVGIQFPGVRSHHGWGKGS